MTEFVDLRNDMCVCMEHVCPCICAFSRVERTYNPDSFSSMPYTIRGIIASYLLEDAKNLSTWIIKRKVMQILYTSLFLTEKKCYKDL